VTRSSPLGRLNPSAPFSFDCANDWLRAVFEALDGSLPSFLKNSRDDSIRRQITAATRDRYSASNARTAELTGIDLAAYRYTL
jgi:hypothetical protein